MAGSLFLAAFLLTRRRHAAFSTGASEAQLAELLAAGQITTTEYRERRDVVRERRR